MARELHPEAKAVLDQLDAANLPPIPRALAPEGVRELDVAGDVEPDEVARVNEYSIDGPGGSLPLPVYYPDGRGPFPMVVWFHGGGFVSGGLEKADPVCRAITNEAESIVISVDYRLAPEHPFPAAIEDCYAATEWAAEYAGDIRGDPQRLAVGGASAGGCLAAAVAIMARDRTESYASPDGPDIAYQWLIYPPTDARRTFDAHEENAEGYLLELEDMLWVRDQYFDSPTDRFHPYAYPNEARSLSGLPPATVVTAEFDPLRDDGRAYAKRLENAGVKTEHRHYDGMIHGFFEWVDLDRSSDAIKAVSEDFRQEVG